jgi:hypothetical protein
MCGSPFAGAGSNAPRRDRGRQHRKATDRALRKIYVCNRIDAGEMLRMMKRSVRLHTRADYRARASSGHWFSTPAVGRLLGTDVLNSIAISMN